MGCKPGSGRQGEEEKGEADDGLTPSFMGLPGVRDFVMNDVRVPCSLNIILRFDPTTANASRVLHPSVPKPIPLRENKKKTPGV